MGLLEKQRFYCSPAMSSLVVQSRTKAFAKFSQRLIVLSTYKKAFLPSKECSENFITTLKIFLLKIYFILTLLEVGLSQTRPKAPRQSPIHATVQKPR